MSTIVDNCSASFPYLSKYLKIKNVYYCRFFNEVINKNCLFMYLKIKNVYYCRCYDKTFSLKIYKYLKIKNVYYCR